MKKKGGFGLTYQEVYLMDNLTIEAKAIYGMLSSYAGTGATAYPSVDFMCRKLHISEPRFYRHMNLLVGAGVVEKKKVRDGNTFAGNLYILTPNLQNIQNVSTQNVGTQNVYSQNVYSQNVGDNNNNTNNNSINNNRGNIDYQQIADMYNVTCVSFPRLSKLSEKRKKAIKARLNTYTVEDFKRLFEMAESSSFLKGANNRNWSATFDWLIADGNMAKVLDGNYKNRADSKPREETREERQARLMREWEEEQKNSPYHTDEPFIPDPSLDWGANVRD